MAKKMAPCPPKIILDKTEQNAATIATVAYSEIMSGIVDYGMEVISMIDRK
jgi:hypothetical protein